MHESESGGGDETLSPDSLSGARCSVHQTTGSLPPAPLLAAGRESFRKGANASCLLMVLQLPVLSGCCATGLLAGQTFQNPDAGNMRVRLI